MSRNNALNIVRLQRYNFKYISVEEVLLLEYFLWYYQKNLLHDVVPSRIESETGLKRSKIEKSILLLKEKNFIDFRSEKFRTVYSIHIDAIIDALPKLILNQYKYAYQYFYAIKNPNAFKKKPVKQPLKPTGSLTPKADSAGSLPKKNAQKSGKRNEKPEPPKQMTLF